MSDRIDGVIQTKRETDLDDAFQFVFIDALGQEGKLQLRIVLFNIEDTEQPGNIHGNRCSNGNARYVHVENNNKQQIQKNVGDAGDNQKNQRRTAVSETAQDAGVHVVAHVAEHTEKDDLQVGNGIVPGICRNLHKPQDQRADKQSDYSQRNRAAVQEANRGCSDRFQPFLIISTDTVGNQNRNAGADAEENTQKHFDWL